MHNGPSRSSVRRGEVVGVWAIFWDLHNDISELALVQVLEMSWLALVYKYTFSTITGAWEALKSYEFM